MGSWSLTTTSTTTTTTTTTLRTRTLNLCCQVYDYCVGCLYTAILRLSGFRVRTGAGLLAISGIEFWMRHGGGTASFQAGVFSGAAAGGGGS